MSFHIFWPACTALTFFVLGVIMVVLKYGPRYCRTRNEPLPSDIDWEGKAYSRRISVSVS